MSRKRTPSAEPAEVAPTVADGKPAASVISAIENGVAGHSSDDLPSFLLRERV